MNDSPRIVALFSLALLTVALGAVIYLGTRAGPSLVSTPSSLPMSSAPSAGSAPKAAAAASPKVYASADLSADEQVILEQLNEVRANPPAFLPAWREHLKADRGRSGCDEPASMLDPLVTSEPRQPLAPNQALTDAARLHGRDMLKRNYFEHVNPDGVGANQRAIAAGYPLPVGRAITAGGQGYSDATNGQNIEALHESATSQPDRAWTPAEWRDSIDGLIVDACVPSRGHRNHLLGVSELGAIEHEIGVGAVSGPGKPGDRKASRMLVVIETGLRGDDVRFVTGVVYRDVNTNRRYDHGEGIAGLTVAISEITTTTAPGGGYALPVTANTKGSITAAGAAVPFEVVDQNVKVDFTAR